MATMNVYEARTAFSRIVARAEAGETVIIARGGRPVAQIGPVDAGHRDVVFGDLRGRVRIADDFDSWTSDDEADWYGR